MKILVLNSGSSSQKSSVYEIRDRLPDVPSAPLWESRIEWDGDQAQIYIASGPGLSGKSTAGGSRKEATEQLLNHLLNSSSPIFRDKSEVSVVGHRIVNGGTLYKNPTPVTPEVRSAIERMSIFAPLHNRAELDGIEIVSKMFGPVSQVAVFDTGFHANLPEAAAVYPGPYEWLEKGIRRFGFHGINHEYCARRAAQLLHKNIESLKIVTCHLGNGCSLAAIRDGRSIDTTMGFTPLEGLMMGTRSGTIDPGILTYLARQDQLTGGELDDLLNNKSGLLGISGISGDMRQIVSAMKEGSARAKLAFEIFVHRLAAGIASMTAALNGLDVLVFSAGIGENSPEIRAATCAALTFLGVTIDPEKNAVSVSEQDISLPESAVRMFIVRAQEDWAIAAACWRLLSCVPPGLE
ncbi:MAG: acetate kinase [Acidobacteria bacterium]|nr:acetate kinase [Acidobacteriota bacterium]MBS1866851.1 acetate kinase [Acidobacteriota bacterium]